MRSVALALVACFIGCACAAEPLTPDGHAYAKLSDSDLLQVWSLAHQACLRRARGACDEVDAIDREMPPRGFCYTGAGAAGRWTKCDGKTVAAPSAPPQEAASAHAPPPEIAPPAPPHEAAPAPPQEAERASPTPREAALCEALRYAMFTSPQAAARVRALCAEIAPADERSERDANRYVFVVPDRRQWTRAPTGPENWQWVYPGRQWRLDPADPWPPIDR